VEHLFSVRFYDGREWTAVRSELLLIDMRNRSYVYQRILQGLLAEIQHLPV